MSVLPPPNLIFPLSSSPGQEVSTGGLISLGYIRCPAVNTYLSHQRNWFSLHHLSAFRRGVLDSYECAMLRSTLPPDAGFVAAAYCQRSHQTSSRGPVL